MTVLEQKRKQARERQKARRDRLKNGLIPITMYVKQREADVLADAGILPGWCVDAKSAVDRDALATAVRLVFRRGLADVTRDEAAPDDLVEQGDNVSNQDNPQ